MTNEQLYNSIIEDANNTFDFVAIWNADPERIESEEQQKDVQDSVKAHGIEEITNKEEKQDALVRLGRTDYTGKVFKSGEGNDRLLFITDDEEEDARHYDVVFNDDGSSNEKGFCESLQYCKDYIEMHNGTSEGYFSDYKGGTVSIIDLDKDEGTVYDVKVK